MDHKETHVPKKVVVNGKERIVYVPTPEQEMLAKQLHLGSFADVAPLEQHLLIQDEKFPRLMVITASYNMAMRAIRTRLDEDPRSYKFLTGTELLFDYFGEEIWRTSFPRVMQLFLLFGYHDARNSMLHEVVTDLFMGRTRLPSKTYPCCWLFLPDILEVVASRLGESLLVLKEFPRLILKEFDGSMPVMRPEALPAVEGPDDKKLTRSDNGPKPVSDDPDESRRKKREQEKWRRQRDE